MPELTAWRLWYLHEDKLTPLVEGLYTILWDTPVMQAECRRGAGDGRAKHKAPDENCECGLWAVRDRPLPAHRRNGTVFLIKDQFHGWVYGSVSLLGKVIIGERGYRAERQVVRELWTGEPNTAAALTERYQCEVHQL